MSLRQSKEAWLMPLPGREKITLLAFSEHACEHCGLAWPGNARLSEMTGLGRTALHEALRELKRLGLVEEIAYGQGGRGCSTVVRVLPEMEYCAAPCPRCKANLELPKKPVPRKMVAAQTVRKSGGNQERKRCGNREGIHHDTNGAEIGRVCLIPSAQATETVRPPMAGVPAQPYAGGPSAAAIAPAAVRQPSGEPEPSCARAREGQADAAAPLNSSHPNPPRSVGEDLRRRCPDQRWPASLDSIPLIQTSAAKAPDRREAQEPCHPAPGPPRRRELEPVGPVVSGIVARTTQAAAARASPPRGG